MNAAAVDLVHGLVYNGDMKLRRPPKRTAKSNIVNTHEAKTHLSKLLARVERGEEFVIAKAGRPVAKLQPIAASARDRQPGGAEGLIEMGDDFDAPLPADLRNQFE